MEDVTTGTTTTATTSSSANNTPPQEQYSRDSCPPKLPYYATEVDALHESIQTAIDLIQYYSEQTELCRDDDDDDDENATTTNTVNESDSSNKTKRAITDPDEIYQQLDMARNQISTAWQTLYTAYHKTPTTTTTNDDDDDDENENNENGPPLTEREQIRIAYLNMITDSFGNVLEQLHTANTNSNNSSSNNNNNNNNNSIDILADCLQSGYDLLVQLNIPESSSTPSTTVPPPERDHHWYESDFAWKDDDNDDDNNYNNNDDDDEEEDDTMTPHERHRQALGFVNVVN